jgi:Zn-dependent peptidase ImmA (M78 family)
MTTLAKTPDELEIVTRYRDHPPVDLDTLARELGLSVIYADDLGANVAGMLDRAADPERGTSYTIYVNADDPHRRRRFTLAHELGHYLLHRDLMDTELVDDKMYRSPLGSWYERQANRFAADLLLPAHLVRSEFKAGNWTVGELAQIFDVSDQAIRIRLEELGLSG